jgi:hypothetical protein
MNPKNKRVMELALALSEADDATFEQVWSLVFSGRTQWQRLIDEAHICEVVGQIEMHVPIEHDPTALGVLGLPCPNDKCGRGALDEVLSQFQPVGSGAALMYIATHKNGGGNKLVITSRTWSAEDGHTYVAIYDRAKQVLYPELIEDLDQSHHFLVRQVSAK